MVFQRLGRTLPLVILALVCTAAVTFAQVPAAKHVILVIDENSSFSDVKANMPWLVSQGNENGYATKYQSDNGGSLLDYLWLASGSCESSANCTLPSGTHNFNCNGNDCYYPGTTATDAITDNNIFRELNNAGISWKVYAQSYAAAGGKPTTPDNNNGTAYYRRHNGAVWYSDILNNVAGSADKVVDLSDLTSDIDHNALPRFMIIVPDGHHDAHDCPIGTSNCSEAQKLAAADEFLSNTLNPILEMSDFQSGGSGLVFVTFDECGGGTDAGCGAAVYTAIIGPKVTAHTVSSIPYKHENALRTIIDALGLRTYPGAAATAADMSDFFGGGSGPETPQVSIISPTNGESIGSPTTFSASAKPASGRTIVGWHLYVDSTDKYSAGAVDSIAPSISLGSGKHAVIVRAWDNTGVYGDETINVAVSASNPTVTVSTPTNNATIGSPVNLKASAKPPSGGSISKWAVYVDGVSKYSAGKVTSISPQLTMEAGTHHVLTRAWSSSGSYGDQTISVNVASKPAVTVSTPSPKATVTSPFKINASAKPSAGRTIGGWWIYVDSVGKYHAGAVNSISATISGERAGAHTIVVRAWDNHDVYGDQTFTVDVK